MVNHMQEPDAVVYEQMRHLHNDLQEFFNEMKRHAAQWEPRPAPTKETTHE